MLEKPLTSVSGINDYILENNCIRLESELQLQSDIDSDMLIHQISHIEHILPSNFREDQEVNLVTTLACNNSPDKLG